MTNIGEVKAYEYLIRNGYSVQDTTENELYYSKDIDLIAIKDNKSISIEVKWDSRIHQTGNMFIETSSNVEQKKMGWYLFCQADYLFYGDSVNEIFYILKMDDLRDYLENNFTEQRNAADYKCNGSLRKLSRGELVPIADFSKKYNVQVAYCSSSR